MTSRDFVESACCIILVCQGMSATIYLLMLRGVPPRTSTTLRGVPNECPRAFIVIHRRGLSTNICRNCRMSGNNTSHKNGETMKRAQIRKLAMYQVFIAAPTTGCVYLALFMIFRFDRLCPIVSIKKPCDFCYTSSCCIVGPPPDPRIFAREFRFVPRWKPLAEYMQSSKQIRSALTTCPQTSSQRLERLLILISVVES